MYLSLLIWCRCNDAHPRSLTQNLPLKANHNRNNTQTIYLQNSQIFAMWQIGNTSQFIRFQFSGERTASHTQSMAEHVKKKGREKKRKIGWNKVLNRDWTSFPLRWKLMKKKRPPKEDVENPHAKWIDSIRKLTSFSSVTNSGKVCSVSRKYWLDPFAVFPMLSTLQMMVAHLNFWHPITPYFE